MYLFKRISDLQTYLTSVRAGSRTFGFVPTMGALHDGHLSLVERSRAENQLTITSIFVNPTQFNEADDLKRYPRTPVKDIEMLYRVGNEVLFMPDIAEVYPNGPVTAADLDLGGLDQGMEGRYRPGHFAGVATVVRRLLDIVQPERLYLGQKDYQQFLVVRKMIQQLGYNVEAVACPTVREPDGLAMSSRNVRLNPEYRSKAPAIYQSLLTARNLAATEQPPAAARRQALEYLERHGLRPEYFEIVDADTLLPVSSWRDAGRIMACTAAWAGEVRLIDNMLLKES